MKVLLIQDVKGLGRQGEIKNASNGYARNYLIPQGLARAATEGDTKNIAKQVEEIDTHNKELSGILENLKNKTKDNPVMVGIAVGKKGEIFNSIKASDIESALYLYDSAIPKHLEVEIKKPIKELGQHEVSLNLGGGLRSSFTIEVTPSI